MRRNEERESDPNLQAIHPIGGVRFLRISLRSIHWKSCCDDDSRTTSQQFQCSPIANLCPPTGDDTDHPSHIRHLLSLGEVEDGTVRAELMIKEVKFDVRLVANVTRKRIAKDVNESGELL